MKRYFKAALSMCLALVMLLSLAACSGGNKGNNGGVGDGSGIGSETDEIGDGGVDEGGVGSDDGEEVTNTDGLYLYQVGECEVPCKTNIKEYIHGDSVDFEKLAADLGWHPYGKSEHGGKSHNFSYVNDDESRLLSIAFKSSNYELSNFISFTKFKENGDLDRQHFPSVNVERSGNIPAYYISPDSETDLTMNMLVICVYVMENYTDGNDDPLSACINVYNDAYRTYTIPE